MTTSKFKISNKVLSVLLCLAMLLSYLPLSSLTAFAAETPVATGYCNKTGAEASSLTAIWELSTDGTLTIKKSSSGGTLMSDFSTLATSRPSWETYKDQIKKVVIEDDITSLGSYAFYQYTALEEVVIGNGIKTIKTMGFYGCTELTKVTIGSSVRKIQSSAFNGCTSLADVTLPNGITTICTYAFANCPMTEITIPASVTTIENLVFNGTQLTKVTYLGTTDPGANSISVFPYINKAYPTIYVPADYIGTTFCKYTVTKAEATTDTNAIVVSATPAEGGSVAVTVNGEPADKAKKDTVVTITVTENAGYVLKSLVAADADDGNIELTKDDNDDNKYTFTMPEKAVSVTAVFKEDSSLVYIGNTVLGIGTYYKCANNTLTSDGTADDYNAYLTFNEATGYTLNIKNLTVSGVQNTNYGAGIYSANDDIALTINFAGTNIINGAENETNAAIYSLGDLNITGSGTLTANGSATTSSNHIQKSFGIAVDDGKSISITNANIVYANAGCVNYGAGLSQGLRASNILIENSVVYAKGGQSVGQSGYSEGIEVVIGTLRIKGAGTKVEAISGDEGYNKSGISGYGGSNTLYLESGLLRVESKDATGHSYGIAGITLNMTGGVFESVCGTATYAFPIANSPTIAEGFSIYDSDNNIINYTNDHTIFKNYSFVRIAPSHIHEWVYSASGNVITAYCDADGCTNDVGGSVTLVAEDAYYTGSAIAATASGSFTNGATYVITYTDGTETAPSTVGTHTAILTVYENGTEKASVSAEYKISYLTAPGNAYSISGGYEDGDTYWFKDDATITVKAPEGYTISATLDGTYGESVSFSENDSKVVYLKRTSDGAMTNAITISETISFDADAPTGKITIESRGFWEKLINKITFGLFFKGDKVATVTTADADGSGVKSIQYYLVDKDLVGDDTLADADAIAALEAAVDGNWSDYKDEIALTKNAKNVIYVKITDNVGNVTYINSEGIVLYTDAEADTESVSTIYKAGKDKDVSVKLNGNTVKSVANGTTTLTVGTDYSVSTDGVITLKATYLDTLNAGEYTFTVSYNPLGLEYTEATENDVPATTTFKVTVEKAKLTVTAEDKSATYGDSAPNYTVKITGWKNGDTKDVLGGKLKFTCDYAKFSDKGSYTIKASGYEADNYTFNYVDGTLSVSAKPITVTIANKTSVYGDSIATLTADDNGGIVNNDSNVYKLTTTATNSSAVSKYDITGEALDDNYSITFANEDNAYEITTRELTVSVVVANKQYDGLNGATITSATLNNVVDADKDKITLVNGTATFTTVNVADGISIAFTDFALSGEADVLKNYTLTQPTGVKANITNGWNPAVNNEYTVSAPNSNGWLNTDLVITAKDGFELSRTNTADGTWTNTLDGVKEGADSTEQFYIRNTNTGAISELVTVNYKLDKNTESTTTTGKVSFDERNGWEKFWNTVTFGLFYKDEVTVKAEATDKLSEVESIEYYAVESSSATALTLEQVQALADDAWTTMPKDGVGVTVEDAKQFVYYIRITDKAGNETYLSTNGAEYDTTLPAISGVEDGKTYYTTQVVTIEDKNLESVVLKSGDADAETVTLDNGKLTLAGDVDTTYTITVTDKAGNVTTVVVTMKEIASVKETIKDITEDDVTSSDKDTVQDVIDHVDELLKDDDLTEDEKKVLEDIKTEAEKLIDKVEETDAADETEDINKVKDITSENVTTDDKEDLEKAKEDMEKALEDYKDNLTEDEKKAIQDEIDRIDDALDIIEKVESVEDAVDKLPDNISKDDVDEVDAAKKAYDGLSDYEKTLIDPNTKKKLDAALKAVEELKSPQTGDSTNFMALFMMMFGSMAALFGILFGTKKKKEEE